MSIIFMHFKLDFNCAEPEMLSVAIIYIEKDAYFGELDQSVKCLLCKHEALSLISRIQMKTNKCMVWLQVFVTLALGVEIDRFLKLAGDPRSQ